MREPSSGLAQRRESVEGSKARRRRPREPGARARRRVAARSSPRKQGSAAGRRGAPVRARRCADRAWPRRVSPGSKPGRALREPEPREDPGQAAVEVGDQPVAGPLRAGQQRLARARPGAPGRRRRVVLEEPREKRARNAEARRAVGRQKVERTTPRHQRARAPRSAGAGASGTTRSRRRLREDARKGVAHMRGREGLRRASRARSA